MVLSSSKRFFTHLRRAPELAAGPPDLLRALPPELPHLGQMQFVFHARRHDPGRAGPGLQRSWSRAGSSMHPTTAVPHRPRLRRISSPRACSATGSYLGARTAAIVLRHYGSWMFRASWSKPSSREHARRFTHCLYTRAGKVGVAGRNGPTLADEACVAESGKPVVVVVVILR